LVAIKKVVMNCTVSETLETPIKKQITVGKMMEEDSNHVVAAKDVKEVLSKLGLYLDQLVKEFSVVSFKAEDADEQLPSLRDKLASLCAALSGFKNRLGTNQLQPQRKCHKTFKRALHEISNDLYVALSAAKLGFTPEAFMSGGGGGGSALPKVLDSVVRSIEKDEVCDSVQTLKREILRMTMAGGEIQALKEVIAMDAKIQPLMEGFGADDFEEGDKEADFLNGLVDATAATLTICDNDEEGEDGTCLTPKQLDQVMDKFVTQEEEEGSGGGKDKMKARLAFSTWLTICTCVVLSPFATTDD